MSIFGTRPEAIKMAPLVKTLEREPGIESVVCVTGQHSTMLDQVLQLFDIAPDHNLQLMAPDQTLNGLTAKIIDAVDPVLQAVRPDRVLVHGDTTTAMASALCAFHRGIRVDHVEAGLRTRDMYQPWPEEMNRRTIDVVCDMLFAPTRSSSANLCAENLPGRIFVTGNTVIDTLLLTVRRLDGDPALCARLDAQLPRLDPHRRILLVTGHRRENFGDGFHNICDALVLLSRRRDLQIVYPVHLNPNVQKPVMERLGSAAHIHLVKPLDYLGFVRLMQRAHIVLTDSGGVQEEAPSLGKPVLVMRDVTERPEAVQAGTVQLVGTHVDTICDAAERLLDDERAYQAISRRVNPYGDGRASRRIVDAIRGATIDEFNPASAAGPGAGRAAAGIRAA